MERIEFIEGYCEKDRIGDNSVLYALIRCLNVEDAASLLQRSLPGNLLLRNASLKIVIENCSESWKKIYNDLIEHIVETFPELPPNRRG